MCWQTEYHVRCEGVVVFTFPCQHTGNRKGHEEEINMNCKQKEAEMRTSVWHAALNNNSRVMCIHINEMEEQKKWELEQQRIQDETENAVEEASRKIDNTAAEEDLETKLEHPTEDWWVGGRIWQGETACCRWYAKACPRLKNNCLEKKTLFHPRVVELKFWKGSTENV